MPKTFVIKVKYGGLGDHLFWSHLPRIAKMVGKYERVYISNLSEYRHLDYRKLVWELNPFVDGFCDEDGPYPEFALVAPGMNLLDKTMLELGMDDNQRYHEPELFYTPRLRPELSGKTVFDPNYVSYVGEVSNRKLTNFLANNGGIDFQIGPRGKVFGVQNDIPFLNTRDIFEYCDVIISCQKFICLTSGGATLAAALGKSCVALYGYGQKPLFHHSKLHHYVNVSPKSAKWLYPVTRCFISKAFRFLKFG